MSANKLEGGAMPAGVYQLKVEWLGMPGQGYAFNILHLAGDPGDADQAHADTLAGLLDTAFTGASNWQDHISDQASLNAIYLKELSTPPSAEYTSLIATPGLASGNVLPPSVALVTSLTTDHGGRRGRGRIYNAGLCEGDNIGGGFCDGTGAAAVNDGWLAFFAAVTLAGQFRPAVFSRADDAAYDIEGVFTNVIWDNQRRRSS